MQPMTPKFRRLLKRLDRRLKDHDLEAFDAALAEQVRQYYVDNDPAYAAALARTAAPAAPAAEAASRPAPAVRSVAAARRPALLRPAALAHPVHEPPPPGDAAAVSRVLHRAIAEEQRAGPAKPKARAKAARPRAAKPLTRKATAVKKTAAKKTTAKKAPRRER